MPLQKNVLSLPLVGGLNESEDALNSNHVQTMVNARYKKAPAVSKRLGYDSIAPFNQYESTLNPPTIEKLVTYRDELLRIGGGELGSYELNDTNLTDWVYRDRVPECIMETSGTVASGVTTSSFSNPSVAIVGGYLIASYVINAFSGSSVYCDVIRLSTGARVYSQRLVATASAIGSVKVVALPATLSACLIWANADSHVIEGQFFFSLTSTFGPTATIAADANTALGLYSFDADALSPSEVALFYEVASGTQRLTCVSFQNEIVAGAFTRTHGPVQVNLPLTLSPSLSIRCASSQVWLGIAGPATGFGANGMYVGTMSLSLANTATPQPAPFAGTGNVSCAVMELSPSSAIVVWSTQSEIYWNEATASGGVVTYAYAFASRRLLGFNMVSRPLLRNGRAYLLIQSFHPTHGSQFLIDLSAGEDLPANRSPRIVAAILPRQLPGNAVPRRYSTAPWAEISPNEYMTVTAVLSSSGTALTTTLAKARFDAAWTRTTAILDNLLVLGGGVLSAYDSSHISELGFTYEPPAFSATGGTGGALTSSSSYGYKIVYAWTDAAGNTHRSAPSLAVVIALDGTQTKTTMSFPCLNLTNKLGDITIEVYRTLANEAVYHLVGTTPNSMGSYSVSYIDTKADSDIASAPTLYTEGGIKPHYMPAGGANVLAWRSCILLHASDDNSLWISGEKLAGEGIWFNPEFNIANFESGPITALATLDATPVLFKADSAYYLEGDPPSDVGQSSIGAPKRIQTEVGCTDPSSIVTTKFGLARMARSGLFIMDSSLNDTYVGRSMEDSYRGKGIAGAEIIPSQGLIRWVQKGTGGNRDALNWDYIHTENLASAVWFKDAFLDVETTGMPEASPVACTTWQGSFVWADASGHVYRENPSSYSDVSYDGGQRAWIPMTFETAVAKPFGIAGWERVWRVILTMKRESACDFRLTFRNDTASKTYVVTDAEIQARWLRPDGNIRFPHHVANQKGSWTQVTIEDASPSSPVGGFGNRKGLSIRDITLEIGQKPGAVKIRNR